MSDLRPANAAPVRRRQIRTTRPLHTFGDKAGAPLGAFTRPGAADGVAFQRAAPEQPGLTLLAFANGHEREARAVELAILNGHRSLAGAYRTRDLLANDR